MGTFSQYIQVNLLKHLFKSASFSQPTNLYIGLCTSTPSTSSIGIECTGVNYSRVICNDWSISNTSPAKVSNTNAISFPIPGAGGWGYVTHFIIMDSLTSSANLVAWGSLGTYYIIKSNDSVTFQAGNFILSLD